MGVTSQLYELQELDQEIDSKSRELQLKTVQMSKNEALANAQNELAAAQQRLDELKKRQRSTEVEMNDLGVKIAAGEKDLYSGRITNAKELSSLQKEIKALKAKHDQGETEALKVMEQATKAEADVAAASGKVKQLEGEWQSLQKQLAVEIEALKARLAELKQQRQEIGADIDPSIVTLYERLRKQKGVALARVEQGICRGCRISLSSNEIQKARSGNAVQCSSCGRILYIP